MDELVKLWEKPLAGEKYMIAGWHQWADAGSVSSGLPEYLIGHTRAKKIGEIQPHGFYIFQVPGMHHFLRPEIKLEQGYRQELSAPKNDIYYSGNDRKGLFIFLGDEPHLSIERYAGAFFDAAQTLGVRRVAAVGGVYGPVPYEKDREVSCVYSLPRMKEEMSRYAVKFSDYAGGVSIGTYMADEAERRGLEYLSLYAFVPAYDFSQISQDLQGIGIEVDFKAWRDLLRRFNHMFGLSLDLAELEKESAELDTSMQAKLAELAEQEPKIKEFIDQVNKDFSEQSFIPLGDVWERELGDLLDQ